MVKRFVIMADGNMTRWAPGAKSPKHLQVIHNETMLQRLVRQLRQINKEAEIIITSHDERYEVPGAVRYEPMQNVMELDRFTWELIQDNTCFLYGDTYYSDEAVARISAAEGDELFFFSAETAIVAVNVFSAEIMKKHIRQVHEDYLAGRLDTCKGWQVFHSFMNERGEDEDPAEVYVKLADGTQGFNTVEEYNELVESLV